MLSPQQPADRYTDMAEKRNQKFMSCDPFSYKTKDYGQVGCLAANPCTIVSDIWLQRLLQCLPINFHQFLYSQLRYQQG